MNKAEWEYFCTFRNTFKNKIQQWTADLLPYKAQITKLIEEMAKNDGVPVYPIENLIVYNTALDSVQETDEIKLIVVGDNPGKAEQLNKNQAYLVGQAGKIAQNFFAKNAQLELDFRKNAIILNKTPLHTAKTKELLALQKARIPKVNEVLEESQRFMASETALLQQKLNCNLWLVGYSELKPKGIFGIYKDTLKTSYNNFENSKVYVYQHFSMNRFLIDLRDNLSATTPNWHDIQKLGLKHRTEIFGK